MSSHLVTIATFMYPTEAYSLMSLLESEGIKCFLDDQYTVAVNPFLSNAIGGIKLNIMSSDVEKAMEIIKAVNADHEKQRQEQISKNERFSEGFVQVDTFCPECESMNVYRKKVPFYKSLFVALFSNLLMPLALMVKTHYCADCGHVWQQ